jgi:hypothetical protein
MGEETSTDTRETAMLQGSAFAIATTATATTATTATTPDLGLGTWLRRRRDERRARRALEHELADYATVSDRDELAALIAGRGDADSAAAAVLVRQARSDLFRAN